MVGMLSASRLGAAAAESGMRLLRRGSNYGVGGWQSLRSDSWRLGCTGGTRSEQGFVIIRSNRGISRRRRDRLCLSRLNQRSLAGRRIQRAAGRAFRRRSRGKNGLLLLDLDIGNFLLDLRLEFVRRAPEFGQCLAYVAGDLRQLLGPKDDEGQEEQEDRLGKTHALHHTAGKGKAAMRRGATLSESSEHNANDVLSAGRGRQALLVIEKVA